MIQPREDGRFRPEARHDFGVGEIGVQRLDRDVAMERLVHRLVDDASATSPKLSDIRYLPMVLPIIRLEPLAPFGPTQNRE